MSWNAWYCLTPELKSGLVTVELVGQEVKQVLVSQVDVGDSASARARSLTGAVTDGQLTEVDLEDRLGHLDDDDDGGCRVLAFDGGLVLGSGSKGQPRRANKYGSHGSPSTLTVAETLSWAQFPLNNYRG